MTHSLRGVSGIVQIEPLCDPDLSKHLYQGLWLSQASRMSDTLPHLLVCSVAVRAYCGRHAHLTCVYFVRRVCVQPWLVYLVCFDPCVRTLYISQACGGIEDKEA